MKLCLECTILLALGHLAPAAHLRAVHNATQEEFVPNHLYKSQCWQKHPVFIAKNVHVKKTNASNPGAGMDPASITPFETVMKDGFRFVDCIKDQMYYFGDKFGNNKFDYNQGEITNTSIVRYSDTVPKQDQKPMSPAVCFAFCRTVPDMGFFGILNGRHCYCTPFFKAMAGDSKMCDSTCEGNPTLMCGSKTKSSVYEMHMCNDVGKELEKGIKGLETVTTPLKILAKSIETTAKDVMQNEGAALQEMFGLVGDPPAAGLCQEMKLHAGDLIHFAKPVTKAIKEAEKELAPVEALAGKTDLTYDEQMEAEKARDEIAKTAHGGVASLKKAHSAYFAAAPEALPHGPYNTSVNASHQYYPIMYFVDKEFEKVPTTCGGKTITNLVASMDGCATACDRKVGECVGFVFMGAKSDVQGFCFLFSEFQTAQYYTGCDAEAKGGSGCSGGFKCMVKFSKFDGTTLKPDASGKCKQCLKEATKADRCFDVPKGSVGCGSPPITYDDDAFDIPDPSVLPPLPPAPAPPPADDGRHAKTIWEDDF